MNTPVFLLLLFQFLSIGTGKNQQEEFRHFKVRVTYQQHYRLDSTVSSQKQEEMILDIGEGFSRFSSAGQLKKDSIMETLKENASLRAVNLIKQMPRTDFNYKIYKGIPTGKISYFEKLGRDPILYTEPLQPMQWRLSKELDTLKGFPVQKATTVFRGRNYIAWFSPEIPLLEGPYKFSGLPGLILDLRDEEGHYHFQFSGIRYLKDPLPVQFDLSSPLHLTREAFLKRKEVHQQNPLASLNRAGIQIRFAPDQKRKVDQNIKERQRSRNNPIERSSN